MNSLTIGLISAGCIFGGALLGLLLQGLLPQPHLRLLGAISARKQPETHIGLMSYCADLSWKGALSWGLKKCAA